MAMIKCKECGAEVSTKAAACPKCGAKQPRRTSLFTWVIAAVVLVAGLGAVVGANKKDERAEQRVALEVARQARMTPQERASEAAAKEKLAEAKALEEARFQQVVALARALKQSMKDPASFDLNNAVRTTAGAVCMEFRAKNSFGATVPGYMVLSPKGEVAQGSSGDTARLWNAHCAKQPGVDMSHVRAAL